MVYKRGVQDLKILLVGPYWFGGVTEYIKKALQQLGCEVKLFTADRVNKKFLEHKIIDGISCFSFLDDIELFKKYLYKRVSSKTEKILNSEFVEEVVEFSPDAIFMIIGLTNLITSQSLKIIKQKTNVPLIIWCLDDPLQHYEITKSFLYYDYIFTVDPIFIQQLRLLSDRPIIYLPGAADPEVYRPVELSEEEKQRYGCDIACLSSVEYHENGAGVLRAQVLQSLVEYKIKIYGNPLWLKLLTDFPQLKKYLSGGYLLPPEVNKLYNAAQVILNIHRPQIRCGVSPKTYEIAAAGAFQLVDKRAELGNQFEIGEEIICYESIKELKELAKYYLNHPEERKKIAAKARQKVLDRHTYVHRMKTVLDYISKV